MLDARAPSSQTSSRRTCVFGQLHRRTLKLSALHRQLGISRQAVNRLVGHGVLRVDLAPDSKRDKIVSVTDKGQVLRTLATLQIHEIETSRAEIIGEGDTEVLRNLLVRRVNPESRESAQDPRVDYPATRTGSPRLFHFGIAS